MTTFVIKVSFHRRGVDSGGEAEVDRWSVVMMVSTVAAAGSGLGTTVVCSDVSSEVMLAFSGVVACPLVVASVILMFIPPAVDS